MSDLGFAVGVDNALTGMEFGRETNDSDTTDFIFHGL